MKLARYGTSDSGNWSSMDSDNWSSMDSGNWSGMDSGNSNWSNSGNNWLRTNGKASSHLDRGGHMYRGNGEVIGGIAIVGRIGGSTIAYSMGEVDTSGTGSNQGRQSYLNNKFNDNSKTNTNF